MKILVLGAGVIGVTTAHQLAKRGHDVTVVDRCSQSAAECSYANGGQLSYSHVEPWANSDTLYKVPGWIVKKDSPLIINPRIDFKMWAWCFKFLASCNDNKSRKSSEHMLRLAMYSRQRLSEIESEEHISYDKSAGGILHTFKNEKSFLYNISQAQFQSQFGCEAKVLQSRQECEAVEPALKHSPAKIIGGIWYPMDEMGDVNKFTLAISESLQKKGNVEFKFNTTIRRMLTHNDEIAGVETDKGVLKADCYVMCAGAMSAVLLRQVGIKAPIYPMKGYSITVPICDSAKAPSIGITDQSNKIVFSRLGNNLRVAGTAEFIGYDDSIKQKRINTIKKMTRELFPEAGDFDNASHWSCLRPQTPDCLPIIGKSGKYKNLFLNTGHGTLGWTMSFGCASAIADIVDGNQPEIDLNGLDTIRYKL